MKSAPSCTTGKHQCTASRVCRIPAISQQHSGHCQACSKSLRYEARMLRFSFGVGPRENIQGTRSKELQRQRGTSRGSFRLLPHPWFHRTLQVSSWANVDGSFITAQNTHTQKGNTRKEESGCVPVCSGRTRSRLP